MWNPHNSGDIDSGVWNCNTMSYFDVSSGYCPVQFNVPNHATVQLKQVTLRDGTTPSMQNLVNGALVHLPQKTKIGWTVKALGMLSSSEDIDTNNCSTPMVDAKRPDKTCQEVVTIPTNGQVQVTNDTPSINLNRGNTLTMIYSISTIINWRPVANGFTGAAQSFSVKNCNAVLATPPTRFCFLTVSFLTLAYGNTATVTNSATSYNVTNGSTILLPLGVSVAYQIPGRPSFTFNTACSGTLNAEGVKSGTWWVAGD